MSNFLNLLYFNYLKDIASSCHELLNMITIISLYLKIVYNVVIITSFV